MTVKHEAVVTCNQCGDSVSLPMSSSLTPFWSGPVGWLTVSYHGVNPMFDMGTDTPDEARNKRPDLCSWKCVMAYAAERAGIEVPT